MILSNEEVKLLLETAILGDNSECQFQLGEYYKYDIKKPEIAFNWYKKAAEKGHKDALFEYAECYIFGYGVKKIKLKHLNTVKKQQN